MFSRILYRENEGNKAVPTTPNVQGSGRVKYNKAHLPSLQQKGQI